LEWLGDIPEHWKESKVKYLGCYINGYPFKPEDWSSDGLPIIRIQNLTNPEASFNRYAGEVNPRCRVRNGDILISWSASLGIFIWNGDEDGWLNQHIFKVSLREDIVDRQFFIWLGDWFIRELQKEAHGSTMTHLTNNMFGGFRVELPPFCEQRAITAFLDRETARIDELVAKKQRLIELLHEQRTAIITRAVTKGLDPSVPMKDSGVEWLGEIPEHWEVKRAKHFYRQAKRQDHPELTVLSVYREYGVIEKSSRDDNANRTPENLDAYQLVQPGDLVINKMKAWQGSLGVSRHTGITSPDYIVYKPLHNENAMYLHYLLRSKLMANVFLANSNGIRPSQWRLEPERFEDLPLIIPPIYEQDKIVAFLERETLQAKDLMERVANASDYLAELRTALISAAVTGKIDVREEVV
jgi:type I restriction enzyme S subunit